MLLDTSNTQEILPSQSKASEILPSQLQASEVTPSQPGASVTIHTEEPTNSSTGEIIQGRVSFPSEVSSGGSRKKSVSTNSFFKNFLMKKLKGGGGGGGVDKISDNGNNNSEVKPVFSDESNRIRSKKEEEEEVEEEKQVERINQCKSKNINDSVEEKENFNIDSSNNCNSDNIGRGEREKKNNSDIKEDNVEREERKNTRKSDITKNNMEREERDNNSNSDIKDNIERENTNNIDGNSDRNTQEEEEDDHHYDTQSNIKDRELSCSPELFSSWEVEKSLERIKKKSVKSKHRTRQRCIKTLILQAETNENNACKNINREESEISDIERQSASLRENKTGTTEQNQSTSENSVIPTAQNQGTNQHNANLRDEEIGTSEDSATDNKILVQELFPDLNNIDRSLLPLLPPQLLLEVEEQLARHTNTNTNTHTHKNTHTNTNTHKNTTTNTNTLHEHTNTKNKPHSKNSPQDKTTIMRYIQCSPKKTCLAPLLTRDGEGQSGTPDLVKCEECHKLVSAFDLPEHIDYHVALKLQNDLRRESGQDQVISTGARSGRGRKRGQVSQVNMDGKKIQKLDSFFTR